MEKAGCRDCKCGKRGTCVVMDLAVSTRQTRSGPLSNTSIAIHVGPKILVCDQTLNIYRDSWPVDTLQIRVFLESGSRKLLSINEEEA